MNPSDTIVAISSPPGAGARGIVRLTGSNCIAIANRIFQAADGKRLADYSVASWIDGEVKIEGLRIPCFVYLFKRPRSFTREDTIEFHMLGVPVLLAEIVEQCLKHGARRAEAGEFSARAYLAGAFDLSQVHGIAGLIAAQSEDQARAAERLLHGSLASTATTARETLADLLSLVEGALDFADEPIEFITPAELVQRLQGVVRELDQTWSAGLHAERWGQLPRVVLVGPPNVGKSSLLNLLTGQNRVISSPVRGTTRDLISAMWSTGEHACELIDIAGLDEVASPLDVRAQEIAQTAIRDAEVLLTVIDGNAWNESSDIPPLWSDAPAIRIINKSDLVDSSRREKIRQKLAHSNDSPIVFMSAVTGEGRETLARQVVKLLSYRTSTVQEAAVALMAEHQEALKTAVETTHRALQMAQASGEYLEQADLVAAELHTAADALGILVGKDLTEERLGRIFSRFCVGK